MKTLYININGEDTQSSDDIIVVGTPDDAIVDKFYYELGKEIVKGVDAPGIRGLAKHVVKSFKDIDELSFDKITKQWLKVKDKLLGENPTGTETIELPMEYVKWLQNYGDIGYTEIAKSLSARNCLVEISLDKIYRNSVNIIINSIEPDNYGQFVVNDEIVTDDSAISKAIIKKFDGIAFKPYKKEVICQKCGRFPCECKQEPVCPQCGKYPCICQYTKSENYIYAIRKRYFFDEENCRWFSFYNKGGKKISKSDYRVIVEGKCQSKRMKRSVLILSKDGCLNRKDGILYYVASADAKLIKIGEYKLNDKDFSVAIHYDKYILYRHKRDYRLYEICRDSSLQLKFEFSSKILLGVKNVNISGNFIWNALYTVDMTNGSIVSDKVQYIEHEQPQTTETLFLCKNNIIISSNDMKEIYRLIEGERFIGFTSSFFVIESHGFIEKYDREGRLLSTIETCKGASDFVLWKNGFVSFNNYGFCGFYDREGKEYRIGKHSYLSHGWQSSGPKIAEIISDNCIHIKEEVYKGRTINTEKYLVDNSDRIIVKNPLTFIDGNNNYGSGFNIEKIDDNFFYCSYTKREKGEFRDLECIVNGEKGVVVCEVNKEYNQELYLIR